MKKWLWLLVLFAWGSPARAFIDVTPTLGRLVNDSSHIVVLRVVRVQPEKRLILFQKVAELKGSQAPDQFKHQITDGFHPREPKAIMDWAEPGQLAVTFYNGPVSQTCIGTYWYECAATTPPWWRMTCGQAQLCFAYSGSVLKLQKALAAMLAGQEVTITAVEYGKQGEYWNACKKAVAARQVPSGKEFPIGRFKASLNMPASIFDAARDADFKVETGPAGPEEVPGLSAALHDPNWQVRAEAAEDLGRMGGTAKDAVPALRAALKDPEDRVRLQAGGALVQIDGTDPEAIPTLISVLQHAAGKARLAAIQVLGDLGPDGGPAVPALAEALQDSNPEVRWAVAESLGKIGPSARAALPALMRAAQDPQQEVAGAAIDALGWMGRDARPAQTLLVQIIQNGAPDLRWPAAVALVHVHPRTAQAAVPLLVEKLRSPDSRNRWQALEYLLDLPSASLAAVPVPLLLEALQDQDIGVRSRAAMTLKEIGPKAQEAVPALQKGLQDSDVWVRVKSACALIQVAGLKGTPALPVLLQGLSDDADIREDCLKALKALGPLAQDAVPGIIQCLGEKESSVQLAAAEALWEIQPDGPRVIPVLLRGLKDSDADIRARAARLLGQIGPEARSSFAALVPVLEDEDEDVRQAAADALAKIDPVQADQVLNQGDQGTLRPAWKAALGLWLLAVVCLPFAAGCWWARNRQGRCGRAFGPEPTFRQPRTEKTACTAQP